MSPDPPGRRARRTPTVFAMGGGGFTMEPDNPALDEYVLSLASAACPSVLLLPTAGGDSEDQIRRFHATFGDRHCEADHLSLFRLGEDPVPLRELVLAQDVIYVGGGSMVNLIAVWRAQGLDRILREAWQAGIVLAGLSAGAMCWFEHGITKGHGLPTVTPGLGFLPGSLSVHRDSEPERRPVHLGAVASGAVPGGYAADDGAGLLFRGPRLAEVVASRPHAQAFRVARAPGRGVIEDALETRYLGPASAGQEPGSHHPPPFAVSELRHARAGRAAAQRSGVRRTYGRD